MKQKHFIPEAEYLTCMQVASLCGCNRASVLLWIEKHGLPAIRPVPGGPYRIPRTGLETWLASKKIGIQPRVNQVEGINSIKEAELLPGDVTVGKTKVPCVAFEVDEDAGIVILWTLSRIKDDGPVSLLLCSLTADGKVIDRPFGPMLRCGSKFRIDRDDPPGRWETIFKKA